MATSLEEDYSSVSWRNNILMQLQNRNRVENNPFANLVQSYSQLLDTAEALKDRSNRLTGEVEQLKLDQVELRLRAGDSAKVNEAALEKKLFLVQEELTSLYRKRSENDQKLIELNNTVQEKDKVLSLNDERLVELSENLLGLKEANEQLQSTIIELEATNQMLKDELQALQLTYLKTEEKLKELRIEHDEMCARWMQVKSDLADKLNEENDKQYKLYKEKQMKELKDAAADISLPIKLPAETVRERPDSLYSGIATIPSRILAKQEAHDGEVNAIAFCSSGKVFATAGSDRKVKLWSIVGGTFEPKGVLTGSNAAVMSLQFNAEEDLLLGASCDYASRIWTIQDHRLRHTLTGHSGKVLAAKFMPGASSIVSGSHDRTLKVWDLKKGCCCTKTIFAGSSCNDLVTSDVIGNNVISGHFDKCIRFWDTRTDASANKIELQGRVTSLDLSPDGQYLLSCSRDEMLKIIDLRQAKILRHLCADGFHVASDWSRATFSPDGQYSVAGSADGAIYIWNTMNGKVEKVLKDREHTSAVMCSLWHPGGSQLLTCDKHRKILVWF